MTGGGGVIQEGFCDFAVHDTTDARTRVGETTGQAPTTTEPLGGERDGGVKGKGATDTVHEALGEIEVPELGGEGGEEEAEEAEQGAEDEWGPNAPTFNDLSYDGAKEVKGSWPKRTNDHDLGGGLIGIGSIPVVPLVDAKGVIVPKDNKGG